MCRVYIKFILSLVVATAIFAGFYYYFDLNIHLKRFFSHAQPATSTTASVPQERFEEGKHYKKLSAKITTSPQVKEFIAQHKEKIQVIEFFGYPCFWCQRLHPFLNDWAAKKPEDILFLRIPVYFNKGWDVLAKAYYVVEKLGQNATLDKEFFLAIHKEHINLGDEKKLEEFFIKQGVSQKQFRKWYHSFEINRAYERGNEIANAYEVTVTPAIILNLASGSYIITASMAGNEQTAIDIINFLIERDLKELPQHGT